MSSMKDLMRVTVRVTRMRSFIDDMRVTRTVRSADFTVMCTPFATVLHGRIRKSHVRPQPP